MILAVISVKNVVEISQSTVSRSKVGNHWITPNFSYNHFILICNGTGCCFSTLIDTSSYSQSNHTSILFFSSDIRSVQIWDLLVLQCTICIRTTPYIVVFCAKRRHNLTIDKNKLGWWIWILLPAPGLPGYRYIISCVRPLSTGGPCTCWSCGSISMAVVWWRI